MLLRGKGRGPARTVGAQDIAAGRGAAQDGEDNNPGGVPRRDPDPHRRAPSPPPPPARGSSSPQSLLQRFSGVGARGMEGAGRGGAAGMFWAAAHALRDLATSGAGGLVTPELGTRSTQG